MCNKICLIGNCFHASKESLCKMKYKKISFFEPEGENSGLGSYYYFNPTNTSDNRYY